LDSKVRRIIVVGHNRERIFKETRLLLSNIAACAAIMCSDHYMSLHDYITCAVISSFRLGPIPTMGRRMSCLVLSYGGMEINDLGLCVVEYLQYTLDR